MTLIFLVMMELVRVITNNLDAFLSVLLAVLANKYAVNFTENGLSILFNAQGEYRTDSYNERILKLLEFHKLWNYHELS